MYSGHIDQPWTRSCRTRSFVSQDSITRFPQLSALDSHNFRDASLDFHNCHRSWLLSSFELARSISRQKQLWSTPLRTAICDLNSSVLGRLHSISTTSTTQFSRLLRLDFHNFHNSSLAISTTRDSQVSNSTSTTFRTLLETGCLEVSDV